MLPYPVHFVLCHTMAFGLKVVRNTFYKDDE